MGLFGNGASSLKRTAKSNPRELSNELDEIKKWVDDSRSDNRNCAAFAINKLADADPGTARVLLSECEQLLDDSSKATRACAIGALRFIAEEYPDEIVVYQQKCVEMLRNDPHDTVRSRAAECLGHLGTETAVEALTNAKNNEGKPAVRQTVFDALDTAKETGKSVSEPNVVNQGKNELNRTGMLTECPKCSSSLTDFDGIPRSCPGCGSAIKSFL